MHQVYYTADGQKHVKVKSDNMTNRISNLESSIKNENLDIKSRLQGISTDQNINGSSIKQIHVSLANLKAIVSTDIETTPRDSSCRYLRTLRPLLDPHR